MKLVGTKFQLKVWDFLERRPTEEEAHLLTEIRDTSTLFRVASELRDKGHGNIISYSRKIFIPLTKLCRDVCHYCTFSRDPQKNQHSYMQPDEVMELLREGEKYGCKEALFTLGDKPELRYTRVRKELQELGHETTLSYLFETAGRVLKDTTLLPHLNAGVMTAEDLRNLRTVSVSQGLMLEGVSPRLHKKGGPHHGSPDKKPDVRIKTIREAGVEKILKDVEKTQPNKIRPGKGFSQFRTDSITRKGIKPTKATSILGQIAKNPAARKATKALGVLGTVADAGITFADTYKTSQQKGDTKQRSIGKGLAKVAGGAIGGTIGALAASPIPIPVSYTHLRAHET